LAQFRRYTRFDLSLSRRPIQSPARRSGLNKYGLISSWYPIVQKMKISNSFSPFKANETIVVKEPAGCNRLGK
jgi:hypothetical protein